MSETTTVESEVAGSPDRRTILIVDDETLFARAVARHLQRAGFLAETAHTLAEARSLIARQAPDLVLLDMRLPDGLGMDLLGEIARRPGPALPVVVITAFGDLDDAVSAMKHQAVDYLTKPIDLDALLLKLEKVLDQRRLERRLRNSRERESRQLGVDPLLGTSEAMQALRAQVERVQALSARGDGAPPTVLLLGETGTGKDLCARTIHTGSSRAEAPFVHLDCATLPRELIESELFGHQKGAFTGAHATRSGLVEAAEDGTLFLDEIGELPLDVQSRLLAVLERRSLRRVGETRERPVPAWFIAATNRDLEAMVAEGRFRSDLYYRLNVLCVEIAPLRERREDVCALAAHYLEQTARRYGLPAPSLDDAAAAALTHYDWPGNVRELINLAERAVLLGHGSLLTPRDFGLEHAAPRGTGTADEPRAQRSGKESSGGDASLLPAGFDRMTLDEVEVAAITAALTRAGGNVSEAARSLGVTRMALRYRLQKHQIDPRSAARGDGTTTPR